MSDPRIVLAEVLYRVERGDVLPTTERREAYRRQKADAILTALSERGYIIIASDNLTAALQGLRNDRILFERTIRTLNERPSASAASHISRWSRAAIEDIDAFLTSLTIKSHQKGSVMSDPHTALAEAMHVVGVCHDRHAPGATAHGLDWPAKVHAVLSERGYTIVASDRLAGLDVERLSVTLHRRRHDPRAIANACDQCRRDAGLIAAEYAALSPEATERDCEDCGHAPSHHLDSVGCYCGCGERFAATEKGAPRE